MNSGTLSIKGFTLVELLVVIAIVAVLSVVVILTLNPAELLKQSRDSNRISDMATIKSALSIYLADVVSPSLGSSSLCYMSYNATTSLGCGVFSSGQTATTTATSTLRKVDGTGWIPVNLTGISTRSPLGNLPIDPVNNATYFYAYAASSTTATFEIVSKMESIRYANGGAVSVENTDGGNSSNYYEVGSAPGLAL